MGLLGFILLISGFVLSILGVIGIATGIMNLHLLDILLSGFILLCGLFAGGLGAEILEQQ